MPEAADRSKRWTLAGGLVIVGLIGCTGASPGMAPVDELLDGQLMPEAELRMAERNLDRVLELAEEAQTRSLGPEDSQKALYYAGEVHFAEEEYKSAFRSYQTLLEDFPYSDFLPAIEPKVFAIGENYLSAEPNPVFKDLFSGRTFGVEVMREFWTAYPFSSQADDALVAVASVHFSRGEYLFAIDRYERILTDHPGSEWADLSAYRVGLCHMLESRGPGYDRTPLQAAARVLRAYLERPGSKGFEREAEERLGQAEEMLAEGEWIIAHLYLVREQDRGSRIHLANCVLAYPSTDAARRARKVLEERGWDLSLNSVDTVLPPVPDDSETGPGR